MSHFCQPFLTTARRLLPKAREFCPGAVRRWGLPVGVQATIDDWRPRPGESLQWVAAASASTTVAGRARHLPEQRHPGFDELLTYVDLRTFVAALQDARVIGRNGYVIDSGDRVWGDVPKVYKAGYTAPNHPLLQALRLPAPEPLHGLSAVLSIFSVGNYYHWMFEALPRLELLRQSGVDLASIDWFIVNELDNQFVAPSLEHLGIPLSKLKESREGHAFRCERLLVPSMPCQTNPSRWVCDFLRTTFLQSGAAASSAGPSGRLSTAAPGDAAPGGTAPSSAAPQEQPARLFVSRPPTARRRIVNEAEVEAELQRRGFTKIYLENCTLEQQIGLFAHAQAVVAAHGASMANLVFCPPGARVIELFNPNYVNSCYRAVAQQAALDYGYLIGRGEFGGVVQHMAHCATDIEVDCQALRQLLDQFGL